MNPTKLGGRVALITGSAAGIGHAIAMALAGQGCAIMLHGLEDPAQAQNALEAVQALGVPVSYHQVDLEDPHAIERLVNEGLARFGAIDILINNAVTRHFAPLEDFPPEAWDRALRVNVSAPFHTVRLALPAMRRSGWGRIVNMTSVYGERGTSNRIDYVTSKAALGGMTRAIAAEVAGQGITCNAVCPGSVLTPNIDKRLNHLMVEHGLSREAATREFLAGKQPVPRFIPAEHVAQLILFLCSDAAGEINGANLPMDSGWLAT
jgi:3-hydroxybutyrate dehydrogenase